MTTCSIFGDFRCLVGADRDPIIMRYLKKRKNEEDFFFIFSKKIKYSLSVVVIKNIHRVFQYYPERPQKVDH